MEIPFFDGYNIPVEEFINQIDKFFLHSSPKDYKSFLYNIFFRLEGEAKLIIQNSQIQNHYDIYDVLLQNFNADCIERTLFQVDIPFFDGYNLNLDQFIKHVDDIYECTILPYLSQHRYNRFVNSIIDHLKGDAKQVIQNSKVQNHHDIYDILLKTFKSDLQILNEIIQNLPYYDDYNINFSEYSAIIKNAAAQVPPFHYEQFLNGLWTSWDETLQHAMEQYDCQDHIEIINALEQNFNFNNHDSNFSIASIILDQPSTIELAVTELGKKRI